MRLSGLDDHPPEKILFVDVSEKVYCWRGQTTFPVLSIYLDTEAKLGDCGYSLDSVQSGMETHIFQEICAENSAVYSR
jgi:hypothetical protein